MEYKWQTTAGEISYLKHCAKTLKASKDSYYNNWLAQKARADNLEKLVKDLKEEVSALNLFTKEITEDSSISAATLKANILKVAKENIKMFKQNTNLRRRLYDKSVELDKLKKETEPKKKVDNPTWVQGDYYPYFISEYNLQHDIRTR